MQSQVRFSAGSGEGCREGAGGRFWESLVQSQVRFSRCAARFRKIFKTETLQLLGIPAKFFFLVIIFYIVHVCMLTCLHVCMFACMHVYMFACFHVGMLTVLTALAVFTCLHVFMLTCLHAYMPTC